MTQPSRPAALRHDRGTTLIEAMIALTILLIGMVGMMRLQVYGITSNAGARSQTQALQLARELAAALEQLPPDDALIAEDFTGTEPPDEFGRLVTGNVLAASGYKAWSDSSASVRGATTDARIVALHGHDPLDASLPRFQRRWQVWQMDTATTTGGVKGIAVSVTYREPSLPGLREVVLLTQVSNTGLFSAFAAAYR